MQPEQARIDTFFHADRHAARRKGGLGCAWHDEAYWNCLLDPADWKKSGPCDETGPLPDADRTMPPGIVAGHAPASVSPSTSNPTGAP